MLLLLAFLATNISAQTHQFGFVAKVGNVAKPERIVEQTGFYGNSTKYVQWIKPGNMTILGIVHRLRINKQLFLSGELLFRYANISKGNENTYTSNGVVAKNDQVDRIAESSIALQVKLEWAPFKKRRTSFGIGVGVSRAISTEVATSFSNSSNMNPGFYIEYHYPKAAVNGNDFPVEISFNAGVYHQFNQQTSIGIELTAEPQLGPYYASIPQFGLDDCFCYGYLNVNTIDQLSLTLSIRHFLLKDK